VKKHDHKNEMEVNNDISADSLSNISLMEQVGPLWTRERAFHFYSPGVATCRFSVFCYLLIN